MRRWAVPVAGLAAAIAVALAGFAADPYLQAVRQIAPPHPYPFAVVAGLAGMLLVHAAVLQAILRPASYRRAWGRALAAWALSAALLFAVTMGSIHAPPPLIACWWCLLAATGLLTGLLVRSVVQAFRHRRRTG